MAVSDLESNNPGRIKKAVPDCLQQSLDMHYGSKAVARQARCDEAPQGALLNRAAPLPRSYSNTGLNNRVNRQASRTFRTGSTRTWESIAVFSTLVGG